MYLSFQFVTCNKNFSSFIIIEIFTEIYVKFSNFLQFRYLRKNSGIINVWLWITQNLKAEQILHQT
jgi:hypothetical protein